MQTYGSLRVGHGSSRGRGGKQCTEEKWHEKGKNGERGSPALKGAHQAALCKQQVGTDPLRAPQAGASPHRGQLCGSLRETGFSASAKSPAPAKPGMEAQYCLPPGRQKRAQVDLDKERIKVYMMNKKNRPRCSVERKVPTSLHGILGWVNKP